MVQAVKITSLNDIGTSIMYTTLVPVVNMTGTPTTEKANLQILGNLILSEAGGSYFPPAAQATISQVVAYASQPNITSVGTLTSLAVLGNITSGNANLGNLAIANVFSGSLNGSAASANTANTANTVTLNAQPNITSLGTLTSLNVTGLANLGAVTNITITGGSPNYVLQTDGNGTLSWAAQTGGGGNIGNWTFDNVTATTPENIIVQAGPATNSWASLLSNDGNNSLWVDNYGAHVTTDFAGAQNYWTFGSDGNLTLPSDSSSIKYSNGNMYGMPAGNNGAVQVNWLGSFSDQGGTPSDTYSTLRFDSNGMPTLNGTAAYQQRVDYSPYLQVLAPRVESTDFGIIAGPGLTVVGYDDNYNTPRSAYLSVQDQANATQQWDFGILGEGNNNFTVRDRTNSNVWEFGTDGNLTTPGNIILDNIGDANISSDANININAAGNIWQFGTDGNLTTPGNIILDNIGDANISSDANININAAGNIWQFGTDGNLTLPGNIIVDVAGDANISSDANININAAGNIWQFSSDGDLTIPGNIIVDVAGDANISSDANININAAGNIWQFSSDGTTTFPTANVDLHNGGVQPGQVLQFGSPGQQAIITGPTPEANYAAERLIIQGQRGNGTGEGGDVYVWGGDADTNGGDIKIYAGDADNVSAGSGGYVNLAGGDGFDNGGHININGGESSNGTGGGVNIDGGYGQTDGGTASLQGGYGGTGQGGTVQITGGGSGNGTGSFGNVVLGSGSSGWIFDNTGNLTLPANTFAVNYANGTQVSIGGGSGNTGNVTFDDNIIMGTGDEFGGAGLYLAPGNASIANSAVQYLRVRGGDVATHIHLDTGNNQAYDQYFGDDAKYVKLELGDAGNVVIGTDDANGNLYTWSFGSDSNLTIPGNIQSITTGFPFNSNISFINTPGSTVLVTLTDSVFVFGATETGQVTISGVVGMTQANDTWYYASIDPSNFVLYDDAALTNPVNGNTWTTYISGGLAVAQGYNDISITGGNVEIVNNNGDTWQFSETGNLTLPGNLVIAGNTSVFGTNASLIQTTDDISLLSLSSGSNGGVSSLWVEDIGNVGTSNIAAVYANPTPGSKIVRIAVGQNGSPGPNLWDFNQDGNLTLPRGGIIYETNIPDGALTGNTIVLKPQGGTNADQQLLVYPTAIGADFNHLHLTSGNLYNTELFLGDDDFYVKLANTGNIVLNSNDGTGNAGTWTFGTNDSLTLPRNSIISEVTPATGAAASVNVKQSESSIPNGLFVSLPPATVTNYNVPGTDIMVTVTWVTNGPTLYAPRFAVGAGGTGYTGGGEFGGGDVLTVPYVDMGITGGGNWTWYVGDIASNLILEAGLNSWTFTGDGNLTLPTGGHIIVSGGIVSSGASPAPSISGFSSITLAYGAKIKDTSSDSVSFGQNAGNASQGSQAVAIGLNAGANGQANGAVALGVSAGQLNQGITGIAIGDSAGSSNQGLGAVSIGAAAGFDSQGQYSVAMGYYAGYTSQANNSIILNATGANLNQTVANTFTVAPVRNDVANVAEVMFYNTTSKEVTYGNTISVAGNIAGNNISATGAVFGQVHIGGNLNYAESANLIIVEDKDGFADIIAQNQNSGGNASMNIILVNNDPGNVYMAVGVNSSNFTPLYNTLFEIPDAGYVSHSTTQVIGPQSSESGTSKMYFTYSSGSLALELNDVGAIGWGASYNGNLTPGNFGNVGQVLTTGGANSPPTWSNIPAPTTLANGNSNVNIATANGNVTITANGTSSWTFGTDGILSVPRMAIGASAGANTQGINAVALGASAGANTQGINAVALGNSAGVTTQGSQAVAVGYSAGYYQQGNSAVAIGHEAGETTQGDSAVAIGRRAGEATQGDSAVAIGAYAGYTSQGVSTVAVGLNAGQTNQGNAAVAVGPAAGLTSQGLYAVAIGEQSGLTLQGNNAVAIGKEAGVATQGANAVAVGYAAGQTNQGNNSIILNATGATLNQTVANTFTVAPVRNDTSNIAEVMFYNATSKEVTYGNTISVAGNVTGGNISTAGNISGNTNGFTIGYLNIPQVAASNTTIALTDAGKHYYSTSAGNFTLTVPNNTTTSFATGTAINIVVQSAGNVLVNAASGVTLYMAGNSTAANRVVSNYGMATLMKVATNTWMINGTGVA